MKTYALIAVHLVIAVLLLSVACADHPINKLKGHWVADDGRHVLTVTDKTFAIDADEKAAEDYFIKGDTIFTSLRAQYPYNKYVIKTLGAGRLTLVETGAQEISFTRK